MKWLLLVLLSFSTISMVELSFGTKTVTFKPLLERYWQTNKREGKSVVSSEIKIL